MKRLMNIHINNTKYSNILKLLYQMIVTISLKLILNLNLSFNLIINHHFLFFIYNFHPIFCIINDFDSLFCIMDKLDVLLTNFLYIIDGINAYNIIM